MKGNNAAQPEKYSTKTAQELIEIYNANKDLFDEYFNVTKNISELDKTSENSKLESINEEPEEESEEEIKSESKKLDDEINIESEKLDKLKNFRKFPDIDLFENTLTKLENWKNELYNNSTRETHSNHSFTQCPVRGNFLPAFTTVKEKLTEVKGEDEDVANFLHGIKSIIDKIGREKEREKKFKANLYDTNYTLNDAYEEYKALLSVYKSKIEEKSKEREKSIQTLEQSIYDRNTKKTKLQEKKDEPVNLQTKLSKLKASQKELLKRIYKIRFPSINPLHKEGVKQKLKEMLDESTAATLLTLVNKVFSQKFIPNKDYKSPYAYKPKPSGEKKTAINPYRIALPKALMEQFKGVHQSNVTSSEYGQNSHNSHISNYKPKPSGEKKTAINPSAINPYRIALSKALMEQFNGVRKSNVRSSEYRSSEYGQNSHNSHISNPVNTNKVNTNKVNGIPNRLPWNSDTNIDKVNLNFLTGGDGAKRPLLGSTGSHENGYKRNKTESKTVGKTDSSFTSK